ncbi:MAG TPA: DNA/RNA non-specific endonuclease [Actinomycetota bacterium]|nr:DNA/RNA non-specific endonuclease [Actinomycetota bacterium]
MVGAEQRTQQDSTAERVASRVEQRRRAIQLIDEEDGLAKADDARRVATRIDRLSHYYPDIRPVDVAALEAGEPKAVHAAAVALEKVINDDDFLRVAYLEAGVAAQLCVGRINIRDENGRLDGYGTGSLVSPQLLLTNHHVLPDEKTAVNSVVEFNYQDDPFGLPREARAFALAPDRFFLADQGLDFALVAVAATPEELAGFGYNPLMSEEGKAIIGDFVSIVQHPGGEKKQVALRENRIVDVLEQALHYETDTEPGSSGSPVFNDQWEVVALHHAAVRAPEQPELGGFVNEGIRVSRLMAFIEARQFPAAQQALVDEMRNRPPAVPMARATPGLGASVETRPSPTATPAVPPVPEHRVRLEMPIEITVHSAPVGNGSARPGGAEAVTIDPDFASRKGYDPLFLGTGENEVPLPTLSETLAARAATFTTPEGEESYVLPYHHFSVVLDEERRLARYTAVNIDGATSIRLKRERDRWSYDPRIPEDVQTGEDVYEQNPLDRGHLVRRLDPAWGASEQEAKSANDDTFHFTNCTPQHEDFNQNQTTWAGLEDYILENADNRDFRVSVFTGPILADDDDAYRGVQLPREYWKVVVMVKANGELSATGYLLSQEELIQGLEVAPEEFEYGDYETFGVTVAEIQTRTGLDFGTLVDADPRAALEATAAVSVVERYDQIVL